MILTSDHGVLAVKIIENEDPMMNLIHQTALLYGPSPEIPNNTDYTKMRKTVYEKLVQAQSLLPQGLRFCLYEAYRSLSLQKMLYEQRHHIIQDRYPDWSTHEIFVETTKMIAPVINEDGSRNTPPHSTGGAIDIYLLNDKGEAIDMGIHPKDWMEDVDGSLSLTKATIISHEAQQNRNIMSKVLSQVGFVNYPTEYWHWSYGDRYWAYHQQAPHAIYGSV